MGLFVKKSIEALQAEANATGNKTLKRVLGPWSLVALGVGAIIGAGLFSITGTVAGEFTGPAITISFAIAAMNSMYHSAESVLQLLDMHFQVAVPAILRPYWESAMTAALEHYLSQSGFETLTAKLQMLLNEMSRMTAQEPSIGFPSLEIEI
jgi:hypothetical protein